MKLFEATQIAMELVNRLQPYCDRIEVVGSIRRGRAWVNDIDIVAIPHEEKILAGGFFNVQHLVASITGDQPHGGHSYLACSYRQISVDIYLATPSSWGTLLLIRTGSKQHNIKLCTLARDKGWQLHASGQGLFDGSNRRIAGDTEESIFKALGLLFIPPDQRE
jgi:DNA polymerase (family 10)